MIRIGIICPSEIAFRRFLPSLRKAKGFKYVGVAIATPEEWFGDRLPSVNQNAINQVQISENEKHRSLLMNMGERYLMAIVL